MKKYNSLNPDDVIEIIETDEENDAVLVEYMTRIDRKTKLIQEWMLI